MQYYKYGDDETNNSKYLQDFPPGYNLLAGIPVLTAIMGGVHDEVVSIESIRQIKEELEGSNMLVGYEEYDFGHLGFTLGTDKKVITDTVNIIKQFHQ